MLETEALLPLADRTSMVDYICANSLESAASPPGSPPGSPGRSSNTPILNSTLSAIPPAEVDLELPAISWSECDRWGFLVHRESVFRDELRISSIFYHMSSEREKKLTMGSEVKGCITQASINNFDHQKEVDTRCH